MPRDCTFPDEKDFEDHFRIYKNTHKINVVYKGISLLSRAALYDNVELARQLLSSPHISVNRQPNERASPLSIALGHSFEITKLLLDRDDIDVNEEDANSVTPYMATCVLGRVDTFRLLLDRKFEN